MSTTPAPPSPPQPPAAPSGGASSRAIASLVTGIIGIAGCGLLGPVAWWLGQQELAAVRDGLAPRAGEGLARAGQVLGIITTALLAVGLVVAMFFVLFAFFGAVAGGGH